MILALLCVLLCAAGYLVRDGWPATGHTNLGARPLGALLCTLGYIAVDLSWVSAALGAAILIGFWTDQKHGEGQNAGHRDNSALVDAGYLAYSGITSLIPLAAAGYYFIDPIFSFAPLAGLLKVPIWFAAWTWNMSLRWPWAEPTRVAAITFGASVGALVAYLLGHVT